MAHNQPTTEDAPAVLNLRHMAKRLGISQAALKELAESGQVPAVRAGSSFLFNVKAAEAALAKLAETGREVQR